MDQHGGLGLAPRLAEPVLAVEEILCSRIACRRRLRERPHRPERTGWGERRKAERDRRTMAEMQHIATRTCDSHGFPPAPFWGSPSGKWSAPVDHR